MITNRALVGIVFAVLWMAGMLVESPSIDPQRIGVAAISGGIVGVLMYWLYSRFSDRHRG
jgi:hypothetical protein